MNVERAPTPKWMLPEKLIYLSMRGASPVDQTGGAFLFSLISLVEKGKQCNEQASKGNQQADNPQENHNDLIGCHMRRFPSYGIPTNRFSLTREATPLSWVLFHEDILSSSTKFCNRIFPAGK